MTDTDQLGPHQLHDLYAEVVDTHPAVAEPVRQLLGGDGVNPKILGDATPEQRAAVQNLLVAVVEAWSASHGVYYDEAPEVIRELNRLRARGHAQRIYAQEQAGEDDDTSWEPVDLTDALNGDTDRPTPTILRRSDGRALFYEGRINYLHGPDGVGKSLTALFAAVEVLSDGDHVVWLDYEDPDEATIVARLDDLGVKADAIADRFHYFHPHTAATEANVAQLCAFVVGCVARLVVVDSIGEAFSVDGVDENSDADVTPWFRRVLKALETTGGAILPVDHGTKNGDNPLFPSGSKRKRAQISGAGYLVEAQRPISKEYAGGTLKLTCAKDRHGTFTRGKPAAVVDVGIYPDGGWTFNVHPPEIIAAGDNDKTLARAIVRVVKDLAEEMGSPPSKNQVESSDRVKASAAKKRAAIEYAEALGCIRTEPGGPGRPTLCVYLKDLEP